MGKSIAINLQIPLNLFSRDNFKELRKEIP